MRKIDRFKFTKEGVLIPCSAPKNLIAACYGHSRQWLWKEMTQNEELNYALDEIGYFRRKQKQSFWAKEVSILMQHLGEIFDEDVQKALNSIKESENEKKIKKIYPKKRH